MYDKTELSNGLRILTSSMPHTRSVTISIFVGVGSRYETEEEAGLSHFIEHMLFKGTTQREGPKEISEAIESVGGVLNGGTDKEMTVYWCKVARPHFALGFDLLADMLLNSKFEEDHIQKERKVIVEELNMIMDSPHERVDVLLDEVMWPGQSLGRDIAGSRETVESFTRKMALDYMGHHYTPGNTVISVTGNISHEEVVELTRRYFANWEAPGNTSFVPITCDQCEPRLKVELRKTEQAHVCLAVHGMSLSHPDRYALGMLNVILGEGMSCRLFLEVREKLGLAYDVHSYISHFRDAGSATVYAGVDPKNTYAALEAIMRELNRLKEHIPAGELDKAREYTKGRLLLRMEDTRAVASWIGAQELLLGKVMTVDEVVSVLDRLTKEDLMRVAREVYVADRLNLAVVGPFRSDKKFKALLKF